MKKELNVRKFENNLRKEFVKLYKNHYIELDNFNIDYSTKMITIKFVFGMYGVDKKEYFYESYYYSELSQKVNIGKFLGGIISVFNCM